MIRGCCFLSCFCCLFICMSVWYFKVQCGSPTYASITDGGSLSWPLSPLVSGREIANNVLLCARPPESIWCGLQILAIKAELAAFEGGLWIRTALSRRKKGSLWLGTLHLVIHNNFALHGCCCCCCQFHFSSTFWLVKAFLRLKVLSLALGLESVSSTFIVRTNAEINDFNKCLVFCFSIQTTGC